ncbi:hypothetical protein ACIRPK_36335 [Kitasatospora sp. NPDC101801]|uniref:hypothetical protein n=1 Tax=Kitasatospora sp. NPDC101801 TaxID=3364103 RepID=UPI0037F371D4
MGVMDQDVVVRWESVRLLADDRGREPWAVWDHVTDLWVTAGTAGEVDLYFDRHGAQGCIRRLRYLHDAGIRHT